MKTKKVDMLEELAAAKKELIITAKQMESNLQEDIKDISRRFQPILSFFNGSGSSSKIPSLLLKGFAAIAPLVLSRQKTSAAPASPWVTIGTTALSLLASNQASGLLSKVGNFFSSVKKEKKKPRHRRHLSNRCKSS